VCDGTGSQSTAPDSREEHSKEKVVHENEKGSDDDEVLAALRDKRKGELQQRVQQASFGRAAGYGQLNDVSGAQLLVRCGCPFDVQAIL